jgi:DNA-directed RNA polymerase subunit M/transcription elongation factor TFIIS
MTNVKRCPECDGELKVVLRVTDYGYVTQRVCGTCGYEQEKVRKAKAAAAL